MTNSVPDPDPRPKSERDETQESLEAFFEAQFAAISANYDKDSGLDSGLDSELAGPRDWTPSLGDVEDSFEPPAAAPLLSGDPANHVAWAAVLFGIGTGLWSIVGSVPGVVGWIAGLAGASGLGFLVWRLPTEINDSDDGARI